MDRQRAVTRSGRPVRIVALGAAVIAWGTVATPSTAQPAPKAIVAEANFGGTWDLTWNTRKGPQRKGFIRFTQKGKLLDAVIEGQGRVKAKGEAQGRTFVLRGSRMAMPYVIAGTMDGNRLTGSIKVMGVERTFVGVRRP